MRKTWRVATRGAALGKNNLAKTRPVAVEYRKKSYHSIDVPTVLATTARLSCFRSSAEAAITATCVHLFTKIPPPQRCRSLPGAGRGLHLPSHPLPYLYKDTTRRCLFGRGCYE